jgi:ribosomal protein S27AE
MTQIKFTLKCPQCGSTRFKASTPKPGPDDPVTCAQCGTTVNLAAEKKRLENEARAAVEDRLRGAS